LLTMAQFVMRRVVSPIDSGVPQFEWCYKTLVYAYTHTNGKDVPRRDTVADRLLACLDFVSMFSQTPRPAGFPMLRQDLELCFDATGMKNSVQLLREYVSEMRICANSSTEWVPVVRSYLQAADRCLTAAMQLADTPACAGINNRLGMYNAVMTRAVASGSSDGATFTQAINLSRTMCMFMVVVSVVSSMYYAVELAPEAQDSSHDIGFFFTIRPLLTNASTLLQQNRDAMRPVLSHLVVPSPCVVPWMYVYNVVIRAYPVDTWYTRWQRVVSWRRRVVTEGKTEGKTESKKRRRVDTATDSCKAHCHEWPSRATCEVINIDG